MALGEGCFFFFKCLCVANGHGDTSADLHTIAALTHTCQSVHSSLLGGISWERRGEEKGNDPWKEGARGAERREPLPWQPDSSWKLLFELILVSREWSWDLRSLGRIALAMGVCPWCPVNGQRPCFCVPLCPRSGQKLWRAYQHRGSWRIDGQYAFSSRTQSPFPTQAFQACPMLNLGWKTSKIVSP